MNPSYAHNVKATIHDLLSPLVIKNNGLVRKILLEDDNNSIDALVDDLNVLIDGIRNASFKKYGDIDNISRTETMNHIYERGYQDKEWVVEEKVHGANFSFIIKKGEDGVTVDCGNRSQLLHENTNFFGYQFVRDNLRDNMIALFEHINLLYPPTYCVRVYGELFGGSYPHPEVEKNSLVKSVQKGVYYSPDVYFYGFDITVDGYLLPKKIVYGFFEQFDIFSSEPLFIGTLEECLSYPNAYQSTISHRLGYPPIEDNICEGNVIAPNEPLFFGNGARVILKNKNDKFSERQKKPKAPREKEVEHDLTDEGVAMYEIMLEYVNENRLRNVLSKMEEVKDNMFGKISGDMMGDVMRDFLKDQEYKRVYLELTENDQRTLRKKIANDINNLIRKDFVNMMDGTF